MKTCNCGNKIFAKDLCRKCYYGQPSIKEKATKYRQSARGRQKRAEFVKSDKYQAYVKRKMVMPKIRYQALKNKANRKGLQTDIDFSHYCELLKRPCTYCEGPLSISGIGLDQVNPGKGYTKDNVVPCCYHCNFFKGNHLTYEETKSLIQTLKILRGGRIW